MSKTALHLAGISLAAALAGVTAANAQVLVSQGHLAGDGDHDCADRGRDLQDQRATTCRSTCWAATARPSSALRNEKAGLNTFENSMKKAYTARTFRIPSGKFAENVGQNPVAGAADPRQHRRGARRAADHDRRRDHRCGRRLRRTGRRQGRGLRASRHRQGRRRSQIGRHTGNRNPPFLASPDQRLASGRTRS